MGRRRFLASLAAATLGGIGLAHATIDTGGPRRMTIPTVPMAAGVPRPDDPPATAPRQRVPLPGGGVIESLPGEGNLLALTVDDGTNSEVVRLYTQFAKDSRVRLTYFVNGVNRSWTDNRDLIRPLVDSGQIQLANHTWSHPDLTTVSNSEVAEQITRNARFLSDSYGVNAAPFFRPPYGHHNADVRRVAADLGYTATTLWNGSLSDSSLITEDYIAQMADKYFVPQSIVIGHLNHLPVTHVYGTMLDLIRARGLETVTLNDVFAA
jgi:hypothetical protein